MDFLSTLRNKKSKNMKIRSKILELCASYTQLQIVQERLVKELDCESNTDGRAVFIGKKINNVTALISILKDNIEVYIKEFNITEKQLDKFDLKKSNLYNIIAMEDGFESLSQLQLFISSNNKIIKDVFIKRIEKKEKNVKVDVVQLNGTHHNI